MVFATAVLLSHSFPLTMGSNAGEPLFALFGTLTLGEVAVDCFFILSGFLISRSWLSEPRVLPYLKKRILRIIPGFVVAFLFSVFIAGWIGSTNGVSYLSQLNMLSLASNVLNLTQPNAPPTFEGSFFPDVNGSLWSIRYEFVCYLLVLLLGLMSIINRSFIMVSLWILSLAAFLIFRVGYADASAVGAIRGGDRVMLLRLLPMFLSGAVIGLLDLHRNASWKWLALAACLLIAGLTYRYTAEIALASAGAYLVLGVGFKSGKPKFIENLPDISYGVYLYAWPIQKLVVHFGFANGPWKLFFISLVLSVSAGVLSWHLIEKPALSLKKNRFLLSRLAGVKPS
ncbi:hypothetical protein RD110_15525 [Rhodoferax koreense]|uniref:Acyltransferase 3 domain-containing protein n=1 Tax=Rhodoferax koreensis TaxID=1842727 RepID=A0A1P8JXE5_9BURK|nr:hypothetical protein RD110_15525 [Rhodoferax koreense]